jgi:hypothetical protein
MLHLTKEIKLNQLHSSKAIQSKMDIEEIFMLNAHALMHFHVNGTDFDNNYDVHEEYHNWVNETFNSDTPWYVLLDSDITPANMNTLLFTCGQYCNQYELNSAESLSDLIWYYGLAMEYSNQVELYDAFVELMNLKQESLQN